jgi:prophage antirepressor-like protein
MDTTTQIFNNPDFGEIRITGVNGEPMFVAKDIARTLGYSENTNITTATSFIPNEWKGVFPINTPYGNQDVIAITEQGLYFWLGRSDKPAALPFQKLKTLVTGKGQIYFTEKLRRQHNSTVQQLNN